jgi:hypothetical protein
MGRAQRVFGAWARASAVVAALAPALPAAAATPARLFRADFDAGTPCAATLVPGRGGAGRALRLLPGESCSFSSEGWLAREAGTLSLWVRPEDWSDADARPQLFFEGSGQAGGEPFQLAVGRPAEPGLARLSVAFGAFGDRHQRLFQITAPVAWRTGVWTRLDVTWERGEFLIYANGRAGERMSLVSEALPPATGGRIRLTPRPGPQQASAATALDALELWDAAFPADRIAKRHQAELLPPLPPARISAPRLPLAPAPDGRLDESWAGATRVPLLADAETGFAGLVVPHASFAWSETALHVALEAPLTAPADAFELALAPAGGEPLRVRITPAGLASGSDVRGIVGAALRHADAWSAELALPLARPQPGEALGFELVHRPVQPGALGVGARLAGALALGGAADGVRVHAAPALAAESRFAFELEREAEARATLELVGADGSRERERARFRGRRELALAREARAGTLRLEVEDDAAGALLELSARVAPLELPGLVLVPDTRARSLVAELDLGWLDGRWLGALSAGSAQARLVDRGPAGEEAHALPLREGRGEVRLASGLAPGLHRLTLELASGAETLRLTREVEVPELPWLGTQAGVSDRVLEPWLPVEVAADGGLRVWGRRYHFEGPLLRAVEGRGGPLLRGPVALRLASAAGVETLATTASELAERSAVRAELRGTGSFPLAGIAVRWTSALEYDGLVLTRLELAPTRAATRVDELVLELPLASRYAKYLRGTRHGSMLWRGRVPWNGRLFENRFEPFLWLTDEREGFLWFAESDANWVGAQRPGAVKVRGGAEAGMKLRLIGEPTVLPGPLAYTFGFQATPVKPELPDARAWNFGVGGRPTPHERAIVHYDGYAVADGLFELARPAAVAAADRALARERGVRPFYYGITSATADFHPVFRLFAPLWRSAWSVAYPGGAREATALRGAVPEHRVVGVCPIDPDWQTRTLFDVERLLRETGALGVYTDTDEVFADDNPRHGCGAADAFGRRVATFGILGKRQFAKRLATLVREVGGGRRYWMSHAHTRLIPPVTGFADFWLPGEELTGRVAHRPDFYLRGLAEQAWRVEYRGESSGIVHVLLPQLERGAGSAAVEDASFTEGLLAMAAVSDVNVSSAFTNVERTGEYWGLRERLGLASAEFTGHWEPDLPVRALATDARVSLYRAAKGPVLVVASRAAHTGDVELELELEPGTLGLATGFVARDERSGKLLERRGAHLVVPLGGRRWTYVSLR